MKEAHDRAHAILSSHADQMDLMASVLLERETVEGEACEALLDNKWDEYLAREDDIIAAKDYGRWGVEIDGRTTRPALLPCGQPYHRRQLRLAGTQRPGLS